MKTKILVLALVLVMVGTCMPTMAAQPTGENLITNGSFENGLTADWKAHVGNSAMGELTSATIVELVTNQKTDGNNAVHIISSTTERAVFRQFLPADTMTAGKQYELSACINIVSGTGVRFALREGDVHNGTQVCSLIGTTYSDNNKVSAAVTEGWMRISNIFTCTESTQTNGCSFIIDTHGNAIELYIDDVQVRETDTGLLADNGEFECFSPDFTRLTWEWHNIGFGRRDDQSLPGDVKLVRTEDYGTAIQFTGRANANNNLFLVFDETKLNALPADSTIYVTFRMKVMQVDTTANFVNKTALYHKGPNAAGRFSTLIEFPAAYLNKWVTVEHWYALRDVTNKNLQINMGVLGEGTTALIDKITAQKVDAPTIAKGNTISLKEEEDTPIPKDDENDEYVTAAPIAYTTTRVSVDESYKAGEEATIYAHYPTMEETAQTGILVSAVYSKDNNGVKTLETVKTADMSAVRRGDCGTALELDLSTITVDPEKEYTVESFMWDDVSGLKPLQGSKKVVEALEKAA